MHGLDLTGEKKKNGVEEKAETLISVSVCVFLSFSLDKPGQFWDKQDMSKTFALLWGKILDSSLWIKEAKETRLVWVTILAMKDASGEVQASVVGLADRAKVKVEECREALRVLTSADPDDTSGVEEGRRLIEIAGGWQVVNHDIYRFSTEAKRAFWREEKAKQRKRQWQVKIGMKEVIEELENGGMPDNTKAMAKKLREVHGLKEGEDGSEDGMSAQERREEIEAKISMDNKTEKEWKNCKMDNILSEKESVSPD